MPLFPCVYRLLVLVLLLSSPCHLVLRRLLLLHPGHHLLLLRWRLSPPGHHLMLLLLAAGRVRADVGERLHQHHAQGNGPCHGKQCAHPHPRWGGTAAADDGHARSASPAHAGPRHCADLR